MSSHIGEFACVVLGNRFVRGVVYAVDPEHGWVTVVCGEGEATRLVVVRQNFVTFTGKICENSPQLPVDTTASITTPPTDVAARAHALVDAFRARHIDVQSLDARVVILGGVAVVAPPYRVQDVLCENETVLARVMGVMQEIDGGVSGGGNRV